MSIADAVGMADTPSVSSKRLIVDGEIAAASARSRTDQLRMPRAARIWAPVKAELSSDGDTVLRSWISIETPIREAIWPVGLLDASAFDLYQRYSPDTV